MENEMVRRKTWKEFRDTGFLWWINMILHTFGWAIVVEVDDNNKCVEAYPARVKFRGFDEERNSRGYEQVSAYMDTFASELYRESKE